MWMRISTLSPLKPCMLPPATDASHIASIPYAIPIFEAIIKVHDLPVDRTRWRRRIAPPLRGGSNSSGNERERVSDRHHVRECVRVLYNRGTGAPVHERSAVARVASTADRWILWRVHHLLDL